MPLIRTLLQFSKVPLGELEDLLADVPHEGDVGVGEEEGLGQLGEAGQAPGQLLGLDLQVVRVRHLTELLAEDENLSGGIF